MDGFDDLLAPSRDALEENPFADPFAKRSSSPDPWATPFANGSNDVYNQETEDPYMTPINDSGPTHASTSQSPNSIVASLPLGLPTDDDDSSEPVKSQSLGFRESIPPTFSETATIRPTEAEDVQARVITLEDPIRSGAPVFKETPRSPSSLARSGNEPPSAGSSTTSPAAFSSAFKSPDELASPLERSNVATPGLSTLADSFDEGWQTERAEQTAWSAANATVEDDDSDDDKPIGTIGRGIKPPAAEGQQSSDTSNFRRDDSGLQPVFVISVDDPQKVGDPLRGYTMYTVHTRTTSPMFQKSAFSVLRRYSDFLWLYETLSLSNPGVVVPPVPEKNSFGRFDDQFVRQRRFALEKCIQKTANHPVLSKDPDLKLFLESDTFALDIKHRKAEIAHERGGVLATIGQTIAGPRFHETDDWFDKQKAYLDSLESQLRGLVKAIEAVARQRSEVATATGEFARSVSDLSAADVGKQLSHSLAGLADVEKKAQELQAAQSEQDVVTLMGTVDEYARLINSVRLAFNSRIRTYHTWKSAESDLFRTKQSHEKNRAQGRIPSERLGYSLSQIAEAERRALDAKHEFEHVSKLIKTELARFEQERIEDFKNSLHAFLEGMISKQKELISSWEDYQQILLKRIGGGGVLPDIPRAAA